MVIEIIVYFHAIFSVCYHRKFIEKLKELGLYDIEFKRRLNKIKRCYKNMNPDAIPPKTIRFKMVIEIIVYFHAIFSVSTIIVIVFLMFI